MTTSEHILTFQDVAWKAGLRTLLTLALFAAAYLLFSTAHDTPRYSRETTQMIGIVGMAAMGAASALNFLKLCMPTKLVLTQEGFSVDGLRKKQMVRWKNVQKFEEIELRGGSLAGYVLHPEARAGHRDRVANRVMLLGRVDGTIAVFPEESAGYLVMVLNDWRRRYAPPS